MKTERLYNIWIHLSLWFHGWESTISGITQQMKDLPCLPQIPPEPENKSLTDISKLFSLIACLTGRRCSHCWCRLVWFVDFMFSKLYHKKKEISSGNETTSIKYNLICVDILYTFWSNVLLPASSPKCHRTVSHYERHSHKNGGS